MFEGFFNNPTFIVVIMITFLVQFSMVEFGGDFTKCTALNARQNLICVAIGFLSLPWGFIIKFLPLRWFQCLSIDDKPMDEDEASRSVAS